MFRLLLTGLQKFVIALFKKKAGKVILLRIRRFLFKTMSASDIFNSVNVKKCI